MTNTAAALRSKSPAPAKAGVKDVTGALRSRRYRHRRRQNKNDSNVKANVTVRADRRVTVSTIDMCRLAARLEAGAATAAEQQLAGRAAGDIIALQGE
jgi:hypothetical protein